MSSTQPQHAGSDHCVQRAGQEQVGELVQRASQQLTERVRGELRLAQAEMKEKGALRRQAHDKLPAPVKDKAAQAPEQARAKAAQAGQMWHEPVPQKTTQGARLARRTARCCWRQGSRRSWCGWPAAAKGKPAGMRLMETRPGNPRRTARLTRPLVAAEII